MHSVLTLFGTRPEVVKLAPVIHALESRGGFRTINVSSTQHTDLLYPFVERLGIRLDHDLKVMRPGQTPSQVCARVMEALEPLLEAERPSVLLVQGDTTTALAGALAAFQKHVPVGHVEAGLRSGNRDSPFPEEMNRRLITRIAAWHFAATPKNVEVLRREGVPEEDVFLTGNPVVDALLSVLKSDTPEPELQPILPHLEGKRVLAVTTHRRESFGDPMRNNLEVLRKFVERHEDVVLVLPVHPNPNVTDPVATILGGHPRIHLLKPLGYPAFIQLLSRAWLIVSDSGGVQEEAPTLKKPLLVLRENTERPEAIESGVARLVGGSAAQLETMLEDLYSDDTWFRQMRVLANPFGQGDSGERIARAIEDLLNRRRENTP